VAEVVRLVASGFEALEGPVVDEAGDLYVADLRAGGIHRYRPGSGSDLVVGERTGVGGMALHAEGGLVASGASLVHLRNGTARSLLDLADLRGPDAAGFNDLAADPQGRVLAGVLRRDGEGAPMPGSLVRVSGPHDYEVLHDDIHPNGIAFTPDGERLYVADTFRRRILVFSSAGDDLRPVDAISTGGVPGLPDGLAADIDGGIWVAFYRGGCIARFDRDGTVRSVIEMPCPKPLSLCFAGPESTELYVVSGRSEAGATDTGSIYLVEVGGLGAPVHAVTV